MNNFIIVSGSSGCLTQPTAHQLQLAMKLNHPVTLYFDVEFCLFYFSNSYCVIVMDNKSDLGQVRGKIGQLQELVSCLTIGWIEN